MNIIPICYNNQMMGERVGRRKASRQSISSTLNPSVLRVDCQRVKLKLSVIYPMMEHPLIIWISPLFAILFAFFFSEMVLKILEGLRNKFESLQGLKSCRKIYSYYNNLCNSNAELEILNSRAQIEYDIFISKF